MHIRQQLGMRGEGHALRYLESRGYSLFQKNFSVHRIGEIDLLLWHDGMLVCVEVKTRHRTAVPFEHLIPRSKQRKIIKTARCVVQRHQLAQVTVRFDAVFVDLSGHEPVITHYPNAFRVE